MFSHRPLLVIAALAFSSLLAACGQSDLPTGVDPSTSNAAGSINLATAAVKTVILLTPPAVNAPFRAAKGKAVFRVAGAQRQLEIGVEHVRPGTEVDFFVGGAPVGTRQIVDTLRAARISLSTRLGDAVPASVTGLLVEIRTAAGRLIVSGSF